MRFRRIATAFAVILPVSLGLGLVYLASAGRIDPATALMMVLCGAVLLAGAISLRDISRGRRFDEED